MSMKTILIKFKNGEEMRLRIYNEDINLVGKDRFYGINDQLEIAGYWEINKTEVTYWVAIN